MTVEEMRRVREESPNVAYVSFISLTKAGIKGYFCFFEGKDAPYYVPRIKSIYKGIIHPIICGGKSKVLKVHELISYHHEYKKYIKGFFIDKDFDPSPPNHTGSPIYETPTYAIENFYSSINVFSQILKSEFALIETDQDYINCITLFKERQQEFHTVTTLFNSWYACLKDTKNKKNLPSTNVNLNDKLPKGFLTIQLDIVTQNYSIESIKQKFIESIEFNQADLESKIIEFNAIEKQKLFRGKYEIEFMIAFLRKLIASANDKRDFKYLTKKTKFNINETQIITQLSSYADTPNCLIDYLKLTTS